MSAASSSTNFQHGFPTPGPQTPTGQEVMNHVFFLSQTEWKEVREEQQFDYIAIGSGFCALGFVKQVLENDPNARILIIERGTFFLPEHFQNLPLPYQKTLGGMSETFPWTISAQTLDNKFIKWQHGMVPFFGGRSTLWSAWCPEPTTEDLQDWHPLVIAAANKYFESARKLLNVREADDPKYIKIFGELQTKLTAQLTEHLSDIDSATRIIAAPLAVGNADPESTEFEKFCIPGPLLAEVVKYQREAEKAGKRRIDSRLSIVTECTVTRILQQHNKATAMETTRGVVNVGNSKIVLAMGTLPATTLVLNSFPQVKNAGQRFTAHFISAIVARIPRKDFDFEQQLHKQNTINEKLELAAIYLAGVDKKTNGQYHIQLTGISDTDPTESSHIARAARNMPDVVATASPDQLKDSQDSVVFVCAVLGELDYRNKNNWLVKNDGNDPTTNVTLQVLENANDLSVWDTMDEGTFQALERVLSPKGADRVEYWHSATGEWQPERDKFRVDGLVHEASTMWIGDDKEAVVGLDYRLQGVENVYVTGASLWPTGGSWNPTLTMVALAQHLADNLTAEKKAQESKTSRLD